jgi:hypothetical protein
MDFPVPSRDVTNSDIPAGDWKPTNLFYSVHHLVRAFLRILFSIEQK